MATQTAESSQDIAEVPSFTVTFIIRRFDPEKDAEPY